jgi:hypothetical protein
MSISVTEGSGFIEASALQSNSAEKEHNSTELSAIPADVSCANPDFSHLLAHRGSESAKVVVQQPLLAIRGEPRCQRIVAQNGSILEPWKAALWKQRLMLAW